MPSTQSNGGLEGGDQRVRVPKMAEVVAATLRGKIVRGELREGDALPSESDLMERYGLSRSTLREALRVLESESLLTTRRGSRHGARVHAPSPEIAARYAGMVLQANGTTLGDVYAARAEIEPPAVGLLAQRRPREALRELEEILDQSAALIADPARYAHFSALFHERIVELAGNNTLALFQKVLAEIIEAHTVASTMRDYDLDQIDRAGRVRSSLRTHEKCLALVKSGDVAAAEQFWRRHMQVAAQWMDSQATRQVLDVLTE